MSYVGNTPTTQGFSPAVDYFSGTGSQTAFVCSRPIASTAQVVVVVNNVTQNPSSAYTVSGNTITFTGAPSSGTNNIYVSYTSPITQVQGLTQSPSVIGPMYVSINGATPLGGATNPILGTSGSANNYVQSYVLNQTNGANSSADFTAYPSNGTDASGWVDVGITSLAYSSALYSVTGPNESYLFGSAPSGSGTTGNLVIATDSTGTTNNIQFYNGGFNKAKGAQSATMSVNGLGLGTAVAASGVGIAFPATQSASTDANTLDDYEEGTWTPVITQSTTNPTSVVYTRQQGRYVKIGQFVYASLSINITSLTNGTGNCRISGLPFTVESLDESDRSCLSIGYANGFSTTTTPCGGIALNGSNSIDLTMRDGADSRTTITSYPVSFGTTLNLYATLCYRTTT